jgi:hypothetical protein
MQIPPRRFTWLAALAGLQTCVTFFLLALLLPTGRIASESGNAAAPSVGGAVLFALFSGLVTAAVVVVVSIIECWVRRKD